MILKATDDERLQEYVGRDISAQTVGERIVCYRIKGTAKNFILSIFRTYLKGSSYIVNTGHTTLEFVLNENEKIYLGNTI